MERKIVYFDKPGLDNTKETLAIAKERVEELGIKTILVATTRGDTGVRSVEAFKGYNVVVITHNTGFREPNAQELTEENRKAIEGGGGVVLTTTHTFGGVSRALSKKFSTVTIGDIISNVLRIFGQGMKVVCEISLMAADAGLADTTEDAMVICGTGRGADMAVVLTPVNSADFFDLKIKEILCKPHF